MNLNCDAKFSPALVIILLLKPNLTQNANLPPTTGIARCQRSSHYEQTCGQKLPSHLPRHQGLSRVRACVCGFICVYVVLFCRARLCVYSCLLPAQNKPNKFCHVGDGDQIVAFGNEEELRSIIVSGCVCMFMFCLLLSQLPS